MANIWDEFDNAIDTEGLAKDIEEAAGSGGTYEELPDDTYEVSIESMELIKSKSSGNPMVKVVMKVLEGSYKGKRIYWNKVITQAFMFKNKYKNGMSDFLESLVSEMNEPIKIQFKTYNQYHNMIMDVMEAIDGTFEYQIKKCRNEKNNDYTDFYVEEVYVLED